MQYHKASDPDLAMIMISLLSRSRALMDRISEYLADEKDCNSEEEIKYMYATIKTELHDIAKHVNQLRFSKGSELYASSFRLSVIEASAYGMLPRIGSKITSKLYSAVEEVHYRLSKHCKFTDWLQVAEGKYSFVKLTVDTKAEGAKYHLKILSRRLKNYYYAFDSRSKKRFIVFTPEINDGSGKLIADLLESGFAFS